MSAARYDTLVIGAGHNGLVCATYLAQRGQRVAILEAADNVGGLASKREFHPGFCASVAHDFPVCRGRLVRSGAAGCCADDAPSGAKPDD